jgi:hypothetical protein
MKPASWSSQSLGDRCSTGVAGTGVAGTGATFSPHPTIPTIVASKAPMTIVRMFFPRLLNDEFSGSVWKG